MITLLLTLFISLFSICPSNYQVEDHCENNIKRSIDYWEDNSGTLFVSSGYMTSYQELACSESWLKMEETFSTIWGQFTDDYGSYAIANYTIPCSGLYVQVPLFTQSSPSYDATYDYVSSNYSDYAVTSITLFNRKYSPWSTDPSDSGLNYYGHLYYFNLSNGYIFVLNMYQSYNGANQQTYSLDVQLYYSGSLHRVDESKFGLFATNSFTYTDTFFVSDYWLLGEGAEAQYRDGYQTGYNVGVDTGQTAGHTTGYGEGYQDGYQEGLAHADYDSTALTIMQGIIDVGLLPVNVFLMILNFEVFGVNVSGFVSALLTISIVIIIVRFLFGGKSDGK